MNIDKVISIENRLRRVTSAMVTLGATPEALNDLNVAGDIMAEVRHFMVCTADAGMQQVPEIAERLLQYIAPDFGSGRSVLKGSTYEQTVERAKRLRDGERGGFAQALALAWDKADTDNATTIEMAFPHLFLR